MAGSSPRLVLAVAAAVLLAGCTAGNPPVNITDKTPREVWDQYAQFLRKNDFAKSYHLLSSDSKKRYPYMDYYLMFTQTRFGALIRHLFVAWNISKVTYSPDGKRAIVTFQHELFPEFEKKFDMALEGGSWRIRITLAGCLCMPEWDEMILFPETFGVELEPPKKGDKRGGERTLDRGRDRDRGGDRGGDQEAEPGRDRGPEPGAEQKPEKKDEKTPAPTPAPGPTPAPTPEPKPKPAEPEAPREPSPGQ